VSGVGNDRSVLDRLPAPVNVAVVRGICEGACSVRDVSGVTGGVSSVGRSDPLVCLSAVLIYLMLAKIIQLLNDEKAKLYLTKQLNKICTVFVCEKYEE